MAQQANPPRIDLPQGWPRRVKSAMLHVVALAQHATSFTRGWTVNRRIARVPLKAETDELSQEVALQPANLQTA